MSFRIFDSKGFHVEFPNGWIVSVQWGPGNYCDNFYASFDEPAPRKGWQSYTAECAAWPTRGPNNGDLLDGDVFPRLSVEGVLALLNRVAAFPEAQV